MILLLEYKIFDIADSSAAINSLFLDRTIDFENKYKLADVQMMSSPSVVYTIFLSNALPTMLYYPNDVVGDLFMLPSFYKIKGLNTTRTEMHYVKLNNYLLGASLTIENTTLNEFNSNILDNIYANLREDFQTNFTNSSKSTTLNSEEMKKKFPDDSMKRYDESTVVFIMPGDVNQTVATYLIEKAKPYLLDYGSYISKISVSIYLFNPIYEIYFRATFSYTKSLQGTLKFKNYIEGGFPLLYSSHQNDKNLLNFFFIGKLMFMILAICTFLYKFLTVNILLFLTNIFFIFEIFFRFWLYYFYFINSSQFFLCLQDILMKVL